MCAIYMRARAHTKVAIMIFTVTIIERGYFGYNEEGLLYDIR